MNRVRQVVVGGFVLFAGLAVSQVQINVLRDLSGDTIEVGAVKVPFWSAALAQDAQALTLENVRLTLGSTLFEAKRVEVAGLSGSRADLDALLSPTASEPLSVRIGRVGARTVAIPELNVTTKVGDQIRNETYQQVTLKDLVGGKLKEAVAQSMTGEIVDGKNQRTAPFSSAGISLGDVDLAALARLQEVRATQPDEPWSRLYGAVAIENFEILEPANKARIRFGRFSGRDIMGRPTRESPADITAFLSDFGRGEKHSEGESRRAIELLADVLGSFRVGLAEVTDVNAELSGDDKSTLGTVNIDHMAYTAASASAPADMRVDGFALDSPEGRISVASTSLTGFSLEPTIESVKRLQGKALADFSAADWRSLIPLVGTYRQSGVQIDLPRASKPVKAGLKDFEFTADKPVNGAPTNIRLAWNGLSLSLPAGDTEDWAREMRALGYEAIDTSLAVALNWNPQNEEVAITELSIAGREMGKISVTALLGNVTSEAFSADKGAAAAAALSARAKSVTLHIEDARELLDRVLAKAARDQNTTPAKLRSFYAEGAAIVGVSMLGTSQSANTITRSVVDYIKEPRNLTLRVTPRSPSGITLLELLATQDPKKILEKLEVTATAE